LVIPYLVPPSSHARASPDSHLLSLFSPKCIANAVP
jgi:hypothetical protein